MAECAVAAVAEEPTAVLCRGGSGQHVVRVDDRRRVSAIADQAAVAINGENGVDRVQPPRVVVDEVLQVGVHTAGTVEADPELAERLGPSDVQVRPCAVGRAGCGCIQIKDVEQVPEPRFGMDDRRAGQRENRKPH
ncbi:hypothetical protein [Mycolicibacter kumamotonensis]|uniref:Uncharacterized protein n=1 Tax=Mycolicibacter kumamotonensis TaxID=354243 RepID=A0A7K3LJ53_9MYCO|nr:hypothetical protein [Mycolicibacter kumamotonensis]NDJ91656.1 hypothetical protein [Mycolicibacter kumamotonensis]